MAHSPPTQTFELRSFGDLDMAIDVDSEPHRCRAHVWLCGSLSADTVAAFDDAVVDVVFGCPAPNVVVDLRHLTSLDPDGIDALRRMHLALDDQGGHLVMICSEWETPDLRRTDCPFDCLVD